METREGGGEWKAGSVGYLDRADKNVSRCEREATPTVRLSIGVCHLAPGWLSINATSDSSRPSGWAPEHVGRRLVRALLRRLVCHVRLCTRTRPAAAASKILKATLKINKSKS